MNTVSRIITGLVMVGLGAFLTMYLGFLDGPGVDYIAVIYGVLFFFVGFLILFNKREDEIEKIKKKK